MFDRDDTFKRLSLDYRMKVIKCLHFREYKKGEPVLGGRTEKGQYILFVLQGRVRKGLAHKFLQKGEIYGV